MFGFLFLPVGLLLALALGIFCPPPGIALSEFQFLETRLQDPLVILIFLIAGYTLKNPLKELCKKDLLLVKAAILINLIFSPFLAWIAIQSFSLSDGQAIGLAVMAAVPTTLSSAVVLTRSAKGDELRALILTVILALVGLITAPIAVGLCLEQGSKIEVPVLGMMWKLFKLVVVPMAIGKAFAVFINNNTHPSLKYLPSASVILIMLMTISANSGELTSQSSGNILFSVLLAVGLHLLLFFAAWACALGLKLPKGQQAALVFTSSQKTLPLALTILVSLSTSGISKGTIAVATVLCVTFHLSQIFIDAALVPMFTPKEKKPQGSSS